LKIELTPESFAVFQTAYDAWKSRFNESRSNTPLQTPTTIAPLLAHPSRRRPVREIVETLGKESPSNIRHHER